MTTMPDTDPMDNAGDRYETLEAERAVIGAALCCGPDIRMLLDRAPLNPAWFTDLTHQAVWSTTKLLALRDQPATPESAFAEMRVVGIGPGCSLAYLRDLAGAAQFVAGLGSAGTVIRYAQRSARAIVAARLRSALIDALEVAGHAAHSDNDAAEIVVEIGEILLDAIGEIQPLRVALKELDDELDVDDEKDPTA